MGRILIVISLISTSLTFSSILIALKEVEKINKNQEKSLIVFAKHQETYEDKYGRHFVLYTYEDSRKPEDKELKNTQVPISQNIRILNEKGNCVWCALEILGRYAEIPKLYNISKDVEDGGDPLCQNGAGPNSVRQFLDLKGIRYEMHTDKLNGREFLKRICNDEKRGAVFGIKNHALNIVHYDPENNLVKVIDNLDRSLSIQNWNLEKFESLWDGWCFTIYPENDKGFVESQPLKYTLIN